MSIITKASAKTYFITGAFPTQSQFADTIDTYLGLGEAGSQTVQGAVAFQSGITVSANSNFINGVKVSGNQIQNAAYAKTGSIITNVGGVLVPASASITDSYLATTAVSAGTYTNPTVTINSTGRIIDASNGTTPSAGALILLSTVNASGAASVAFDSSVITNTYNKYVIEFDSAVTSGSVDLYMTLSVDNGSNYLAAGYASFVAAGNSGAGFNGGGSSSDTKINMTAGNTFFGSSVNIQGTIKFGKPSAAAPLPIEWRFNSSGSGAGTIIGSGSGPGTTAINNIKIAPATGTITGNFHLYGLSGT